jgi:RNA polymerase sigma factor FliA
MRNTALALRHGDCLINSSPTKSNQNYEKKPQTLICADRLDWIHNLVRKIIKRMNLPLEEYDELVAAGQLGLVEAAERFSADAGVEFKSYAYFRIHGAIIDCIRKNSYLSQRGYRHLKAVQAITDIRRSTDINKYSAKEKQHKLGRIYNFAATGVLAFQLSFLDEELYSSAPAQTTNAETLLEKKQELQMLHKALRILPNREKMILEAYYFGGKTFTEIAKETSLTRPWVSKLHKRALDKLRKYYLQRSLPD